MEEEVRSDIFTVLANFMESQPQVQNSQSNNNNSNITPPMRTDIIGRTVASQVTAMARNSQIESSVNENPARTMNVSVLEANLQQSSARMQTSVGVASDADMAEIERISSTFPFPVPSSTVGSACTDSLMYEGTNHAGMVGSVENGIDPRMSTYPPNSLDFSQNPAAILEALNSMDKDSFTESSGVSSANMPCLRAEPAHAYAQSFVSMLQQQQMDSCGNLWPMNSVQTVSAGTASFSRDIASGKQVAVMNNVQSVAAPDNTVFTPHSSSAVPSNHIENMPQTHLLQNPPSKALLTPQSRMSPKDKVNSLNQQNQNLHQYATLKHSSTNRDLLMPIEKDDAFMKDSGVGSQTKEKKLTTTPIPSDADKSSVSSSGSSSGSISGPEHSPDHTTERDSTGVNHTRCDIEGRLGTKRQPSGQRAGEGVPHNFTATKNFPYRNVNMMNFNTINFSPVMDNTPPGVATDALKTHPGQDLNVPSVPVPTSDSVVEIDETVTSPLENIPVSPPTPTPENDSQSSPKFIDPNRNTHNTVMRVSNHLSAMQRQAPSSMPQNAHMQQNQHSISSMHPANTTRGPSNGSFAPQVSSGPQNPNDKRDSNNNLTQFFNKGAVNSAPDKFKEKQKKQRRSKNQQQSHRHKNGQYDNGLPQKDYTTLSNSGSNIAMNINNSNLTPKVNADPTKKKASSGRPQQVIGGGAHAPHMNNIGHVMHGNGMSSHFQPLPSMVPTSVQSFSRSQSFSTPSNQQNSTQAARQWQTVTAVQGPKLPPMLSEQDRIPKRGRPSKKMMQENLKIKAGANATTNSQQDVKAVPKTTVQKPPPVPNAASKLVSTYTINDKGFMEEVAPKLKENRRSKERTQAFLKLLDDIKSASKHNAMNPKFGEKAKTGSEKQARRRSKPRTKVFGRHSSEPLTESGITETMYTFSALAHQYKISSSIVERATENLLKSAAMKRSKDQPVPSAAIVTERLRLLEKNSKKGAPSPISHCENQTVNVSSKVPVPTMQSQSVYLKPETNGVSNAIARAADVSGVLPKPGAICEDESTDTVPVAPHMETEGPAAPSEVHTEKNEGTGAHIVKDVPTTSQPLDAEPKQSVEEFSPKSKMKKKKHKKHKKHKHLDAKVGLSSKKKKKKKSKKKPKLKMGIGVIPSASVSITKPPLKSKTVPQVSASLSLPTTKGAGSAAPKAASPGAAPHFQDSRSNDASNSPTDWQPDDNAYDGEDSSSDEASTSPKSYPEASAKEKQPQSSLSSFARYSEATVGFGTLTNQKPIPSLPPRDDVAGAPSSAEKTEQPEHFASGVARSKKHHKHNKRKKFSRKPRNICNPTLLAQLDETLSKMNNLAISASPGTNRTASPVPNVFLTITAGDDSGELLWKTPTSGTHKQKSDNHAGIVKGAAFRSGNLQSGIKGNKLGKGGGFSSSIRKTAAQTSPYSSQGNSLSVFCSSPFFQKYGYISKSGQVTSARNRPTPTMHLTQAVTLTKAVSTPLVTANALPSVESAAADVTELESRPEAADNTSPAPKATKPEKRKRGWPRGKPRGPRAKKARSVGRPPSQSSVSKAPPSAAVAETSQASTNKLSDNLRSKRTPDTNETLKTNVDDSSTAGTSRKESTASSTSSSTGGPSAPEADLSKLVSESLLSQIKQAIEANLPAHPSVNKDAITKSVDEAVQSYLQKMNKPAGPTSTPLSITEDSRTFKRKPGRRRTRSRSSLESAPDNVPPASSDVSPRTNADRHPKKLWACKHQDTESTPSSSTTAAEQQQSHLISSPVKKRGPGRPRKHPLPNPRPTQKTDADQAASARMSFSVQGKLPTASATVVPMRRKTSAMRIQGTQFKRAVPAVRMQGKCGRPRLPRPHLTNSGALNKKKDPHSNSRMFTDSTITEERAVSSLDALYSAKSLRSKSRISAFDRVKEPGMYGGTEIEIHIRESIEDTVNHYSWDNYKRFTDACTAIERDMGFADDGESSSNDARRRASGPKKSIESVVEKLKNKQAQSMHSAATALLQLRETQVTSYGGSSGEETPPIAQGNKKQGSYNKNLDQGIFEKMAATLERGSKSYSDKKRNSSDGGPLVKRPRGRPRKHPLPDQDYPIATVPPKKKRTGSYDRKSDSKKERLPFIQREDHAKKGSTKDKVKVPSPLSMHAENPATLPTKSYLEAGLYSSTFKIDSESSMGDSDIEGTDPEETLHTNLPPPLDAGLYLRSSLKDFQLPYDIWWMYKHHKIAVSQEPSNQYIEISKNVYSGPRPTQSLGDHICTCRSKGGQPGCGKQCLNRLMYFECSPSSCPCGSSCTNQSIQKAEWCSTIQRFKTTERGWGVRTTASIPDGGFILEYVGEVLTEAEFRSRTVELYHAYNDHYCVQLDSSTVIDGYRMANEGRFVNHSCDPNCEMQKWCVNGEYRIGLFAMREIKPGEELTYDYNFHAFNVDHQQVCRCGAQKCRGIIGGRTQRSLSSESEVSSTGASTTSAKAVKVKNVRNKKGERADGAPATKDDDLGTKEFSILQMKPLSSNEMTIIRIRQLFLIRNLAQVRKKEEDHQRNLARKSASSSKSSHKSKAKKDRQSKEEAKRIEEAITELYTAIATCKDQNGVSVAIPFMNLPSKKKNPEYYERISNPIDLSVIERNLITHHYKDIETFNSDVQRVFRNAEKYHGRKSTLGKDVTRLRKAYAIARGKVAIQVNGYKKPSKSREVEDEDLDESNENIHRKNADHIRCICCIYKDEGLMVQCEKCYVWQHCDCMGVKPGNTDQYLCEECDPRPVSKEVKVIPPPPNTPPGHTYFVTLLQDNILVKQGDCAYLMRDHRLRHNSDVPSMRALNRNLANIPQESLDIFRIEKLWTDERGDKFAYGYHFLRPHETHHSPSRTFYHNELFVSPFYEIIPLEAVVGLCIVMDLYTFCKGKPKGFKMSDIYICDFRIDKAAGIFTRVTNKKKYPICTKPHVFDSYKHRLCPKKTFQPHQVPEHYKRPVGRPPSKPDSIEEDVALQNKRDIASDDAEEDAGEGTSGAGMECGQEGGDGKGKWTKKKQRLEGIAHKLLSKLPKQAIDVSYLLEPGAGKRQRKKTLLSLESLSQQK